MSFSQQHFSKLNQWQGSGHYNLSGPNPESFGGYCFQQDMPPETHMDITLIFGDLFSVLKTYECPV